MMPDGESLGFADVDENDPLIQCIRRWEIELDTHGWGKPPLLAWLGRTDLPAVGLRGVLAVPVPIPFPASPRDVLAELVDRLIVDQQLRVKLRGSVPGELYGAMVSMEAWLLMADEGGADHARALALGEAGLIHTAPDRVEIRTLIAATIEGRTEMLIRRHDAPPVFTNAGLQGAVVRQLGRVVRAVVRP